MSNISHVHCWERTNPHRCMSCCDCGAQIPRSPALDIPNASDICACGDIFASHIHSGVEGGHTFVPENVNARIDNAALSITRCPTPESCMLADRCLNEEKECDDPHTVTPHVIDIPNVPAMVHHSERFDNMARACAEEVLPRILELADSGCGGSDENLIYELAEALKKFAESEIAWRNAGEWALLARKIALETIGKHGAELESAIEKQLTDYFREGE